MNTPSPPNGLLTLGDLHRIGNLRPEVKNVYYSGKLVNLDGYRWVECRFDRCILNVSSTHFDIVNCVIDSTTTFRYSYELMKVIKLFTSRYPWAQKILGNAFVPKMHEDGSITIDNVPTA